MLRDNFGRSNLSTCIGEAKMYNSSLWKNIVTTWPFLGNMVVWSVGNGDNINVSNDYSIAPGILLREHIHNKLNE